MHDFTEFELQEIIQSNRILADRLDNMVSKVRIVDNSDKEMYLSHQVSKFKKREQLLDHLRSKEFKLPVINRHDRSVDEAHFKKPENMSLLESIKEEYVRINRQNDNSIIDKNKD